MSRFALLRFFRCTNVLMPSRGAALMYFLCCSILLLSSVEMVFAQSTLTVLDPQRQWRTGRGFIEEATIAVTPKGAQMEIGLFLTFSAKNTTLNTASDTLEIVYSFSLPQDAVVTDSWLWVGNDVMQARIQDTWSATAIYESIVRRRQDPSILRKHSPTSYSLRIFPCVGNQSRKVKINYLVPVKWTSTQASVSLPTDLLTASSQPTPFTVLFQTNRDWQNPRMEELKNVSFASSRSGTSNTEFQIVEIQPSLLGTNRALTLSVPAPMPTGIYASTYKSGAEGFYQAVVVPSIALGIDSLIRKKVLVVIDHDSRTTYVPLSDGLTSLRNTLRATLTPRDSFNLVLSRLTPWRFSNTWVSADPASLDRAFAAMNIAQLTSYSNLAASLVSGLDFIRTQGGDGSLLLFTNSVQFASQAASDQLIRDISNTLPKLPPMYICHNSPVGNFSTGGFTVNGVYYAGDTYLNETLARRTGGLSLNAYSVADLNRIFTRCLESMDAQMSAVDFNVSIANGYCHSRFTSMDLNTPNLSFPMRQTLTQVGRFQGEYPLRIQIGGKYKDKTYIRNVELFARDLNVGDSILKTMWSAYAIRAQEALPATPQNIRNVLDLSLSNRILSLYSAFLALEPNDSIRPCTTCFQPNAQPGSPGAVINPSPSAMLSVANNQGKNGAILSASPNPFRTETRISIDMEELDVANRAVTLEIYNLLGQRVASFSFTGVPASGKHTFTWDGKDAFGNDLASGTYLLTVVTPQKRITLRIVKID